MVRQLILLVGSLACATAYGDCFERAATRFNVHPDLLRAIAEQESRYRPDAIGPVLADGNRAVGQMQINTIHLPELARYGVTRQDLLTECGSVFVGAWIFARYAKLAGNTWKAVGIYNTGPASKNFAARDRYITQVRRRFERIQRERSGPLTQRSEIARRMAIWGIE